MMTEGVLDDNKKPLIDIKFSIQAVNTFTGKQHDSSDAVLFLAKDKAFLEGALPGYREACVRLGADQTHLDLIDDLIKRVGEYQDSIGNKINSGN